MVRMRSHIGALRRGTHKNIHLQRAWDKYGENYFVFSILQVCKKEETYIIEQQYLDNRNKELSYNINDLASGLSENEETKEKLRLLRNMFNKEASKYYKMVKNNEISIEEVPIKFVNTIKAHLDNIPWNKGKHYVSTEHLKVKHKTTEKTKKKYKDFSENLRNRADVVYVYDINWNFVDCFRSAKDLADLSTQLNLPLKSRFKNKRGNCEKNELQSCNINKAIKNKKPYKNLYFTNVPLHQGIDDVNEPKSVNTEM